MKIGMLGRACSRGLSTQSWDWYRHIHPDRTIVVDVGMDSSPFPMVLPYPDAWKVLRVDDLAPQWDEFVDGLDVVWTAETSYDYGLFTAARAAGCATVVHANNEFMHWHDGSLPRPDLFLAPSLWGFDDWPSPKAYVPFPVDRERFPFKLRTEARTFLHVAGMATRNDRNGTALVMEAALRVREPMRLVIVSQHNVTPSYRMPHHVELVIREGNPADNRELYSDGDVLVLPRRFGGLSLPMNEAMSLGMPVIGTRRRPEADFLPHATLAHVASRQPMKSQGGIIQLEHADPVELAAIMDRLSTSPEEVEQLSRWSDQVAEQMSWTTLEPAMRAALAKAVDLAH